MPVVETLTFRLAAASDQAAFLEADRAVQDELVPHQPGFWRRTTARGPDGEWLVVTLWRAPEDAEAFGAEWERSPVARRFLSLVDGESLRSGRYTTLD